MEQEPKEMAIDEPQVQDAADATNAPGIPSEM